MGEAAVAAAVLEVIYGAVVHGAVVTEDADRDHCLHAGGVPVAVGEGGEILDRRIHRALEHGLALRDVGGGPFWIGRAYQLGGADELESVEAGGKLHVAAVHGLQS